MKHTDSGGGRFAAYMYVPGLARYSPTAKFDPAHPEIRWNGIPGMVVPGTYPKRILLPTSPEKLPDVYHLSGVYIVSEKFRSIIEETEPRLHHFEKVEIFRKNGKESESSYYVLDIRQRIDAVDPERSEAQWMYNSDKTKSMYSVRPDRYVFKAAAIGNSHLWRGDRYQFNVFFCSDVLMKKIQRARINKINFYVGPSV